ncbi:MAG: PD-(D/E)XK nuclease family protein [Bacteroidia bacterium]|nr:PD-(D/E)XK nuclease family protein [Bacteroidia bacterium]
MPSFIHDVLTHLKTKNVNFSDLTFVLPSKRAGTFLINELSQLSSQTFFAPNIYSIEEYVEELAQLKKLSYTELLFEFYTTYKTVFKEELENFETFSKWAQILLQDFNEIDRYLIDQSKIFNYLSAIQEINTNHWSLDKNKTVLIKRYLAFWNSFELLYNTFKEQLLEKQLGYQGLIYREAFNNIESFIQENSNKYFVFLGFNALNASEIGIIKELLHNDIAQIFWDIDQTFINNTSHDAGLFIRQHKNWNYYNTHKFKWLGKSYASPKNISVIGVPKNVGQAKYIGELLQNLKAKYTKLDNTALVLGNENLLFPMLTSIPNEIDTVNITMGLPLKMIPFSAFLEQLIKMHLTAKSKFYFKDVLALIQNPILSILFARENANLVKKFISIINHNNLVYLNKDEITNLIPDKKEVLSLLFSSWNDKPENAIDAIIKIIYSLKTELDLNKKQHALSLEYLYKFNTILNTIHTLNLKYNYINSIKVFYNVYKELLSVETLDFKGEPLKGLQVMGMLESRVLDFETVIISGVNEGILPSGKSNNSFIPFDVKIENNLPTYKEKDAVYTYHFYHLLQRAKNVYILYNTEPDVLNGGEMSRFITQLEIEGVHEINHSIVAPKTPIINSELEQVKKTKEIINQLKKIAKKGFSPSALTVYIRNPIDFYYQRVLEIYEYDTVEEIVEANTLGTVVHNTLENLYKPFIGSDLTIEALKTIKPKIHSITKKHFKEAYKQGDITSGKNLISFEIAKRYVQNFINSEIQSLKEGNTINVLALEAETKVQIDIPQLDFPVFLNGKIDRIDSFNNTTRIIDYKTGSVLSSQVEIENWEDISSDFKKFSKSFQVLTYTLMLHQNKIIELPVEAGIISFKNLSKGFLKFGKKGVSDTSGKKVKDNIISQDTLENFSNELKKLILEICDPEINFIEKEL